MDGLAQALSQRRWFRRWLKHRIPPQAQHRLQHRNIFILPSKLGLGLLVLVILLWLLGTNYQNNLILGLAFLLLALMVIAIHHTYGNVAGLTIKVVGTHPGFAGGLGRVDLVVSKGGKGDHEAIEISWSPEFTALFSLVAQSRQRLSLQVPLTHRGWFQPGRLLVTTRFPLGLMVAWSHLDFAATLMAYPKPLETTVTPETAHSDVDDPSQRAHPGQEEFAGLRPYQPGDPLNTLDWRALARGQGLTTRTHEDPVSGHQWLDWEQFAGLDREARLSRLCASVLQQGKNNAHYGLRLPGITLNPGHGDTHQEQLLQALALFEWEAIHDLDHS